MNDRWKVLFQTRHYTQAYRKLGLRAADFEQSRFSRSGDLAYPEDNYWASSDGRFRVSAFVDDWGHSCRLVEYANVDLIELATIYERLARELRVAAVADRLYYERHPDQKDGLRISSLVELAEIHDAAEELLK